MIADARAVDCARRGEGAGVGLLDFRDPLICERNPFAVRTHPGHAGEDLLT